MVKKFLSYVDEITNFGSIHMPADEIIATFAWEQGLNRVQVVKLRIALENKGII